MTKDHVLTSRASERERERETERERERERARARAREGGREGERARERARARGSEKEREGERGREGERETERDMGPKCGSGASISVLRLKTRNLFRPPNFTTLHTEHQGAVMIIIVQKY